jgi:predicted DNA-binding transcriptional regulator AlpA
MDMPTTQTTEPRRRGANRPRVVVTNRILRIEAVQEKLGLRKWMLDQWRRDPRFPKPVRLSKRAIGFLESEIDDFLINVLAKERKEGEGK